jgi:Fe-S-cluster-containing dehydrogenase component
MNDYVRGQVPHVKMSFVFVPCQHCENATCIAACPQEAIYRRNDGLVIIDPVKCNGCRECLHPDACPYNAIYWNQNYRIAQKCTGCAHLIDRGEYFSARCAENCPVLALKFGEESELDISSHNETLHPEYGLTTRVHYKNLPKRFIAGTVYDPSSKEIVEGATCTVSGTAGSKTATTNHFGDFWLDGLAEADYTLTISKGGKTKTISVSTIIEDIGLGDIALV